MRLRRLRSVQWAWAARRAPWVPLPSGSKLLSVDAPPFASRQRHRWRPVNMSSCMVTFSVWTDSRTGGSWSQTGRPRVRSRMSGFGASAVSSAPRLRGGRSQGSGRARVPGMSCRPALAESVSSLGSLGLRPRCHLPGLRQRMLLEQGIGRVPSQFVQRTIRSRLRSTCSWHQRKPQCYTAGCRPAKQG